MRARFSFMLMTAAVVMAAVTLNGCPQLLALIPTPTPTPTKKPDQQATLPGGNVGYRVESTVAKPGCNGER